MAHDANHNITNAQHIIPNSNMQYAINFLIDHRTVSDGNKTCNEEKPAEGEAE
jgi:hypothetical protein